MVNCHDHYCILILDRIARLIASAHARESCDFIVVRHLIESIGQHDDESVYTEPGQLATNHVLAIKLSDLNFQCEPAGIALGH